MENRFEIGYIIRENFLDEESFLTSEKFFNSLNEAGKMTVADMTTSRTMAVSKKRLEALNRRKVLGDIPHTKGNVLKSKFYKDTKNSINIMTNLYNQSHGMSLNEAKESIEICKFALENLEKNKTYFEDAFDNNDANIMLLYENTFGLVVSMTAIIIINTTEVDEKCNFKYRDFKKGLLKNNKLIKTIDKFNDMCRNKKLPELKRFNEHLNELDEDMMYNLNEEIEGTKIELGGFLKDAKNRLLVSGNNNGFKGAVKNMWQGKDLPGMNYNDNPNNFRKTLGKMGIIAAFAAAAIAAIYVSRMGICYFFYKKNDIAQDAEYLSGVVQANSIANEYDPTKSGKVSEKQRKLSEKLKKLGKVLDSDSKQAEFNAINNLKREDKLNSQSIEKELEDSANPDIFPTDNSSSGDNLFI